MKKAFITGITGQDGSYLAELLLEKGYKVYGLTRRTSTQNYERISHIMHNENLELISGDLIDQTSIATALNSIQPDEFYNLAAQSFVKTSWDQPRTFCSPPKDQTTSKSRNKRSKRCCIGINHIINSSNCRGNN